jgi:hypothetical protein
VKQSGEFREKDREREKEINGLTERETEHWTEVEMAGVRNGC